MLYQSSNNFMEFFGSKKGNLLTTTFFVVCVIVSGFLLVPFLQIEQLIMTRMQLMTYDVDSSNHDTAINYYHAAFAYHGKEISEKLNYAHFLPLGSGSNNSNQSRQVNQVKVIVNYTVVEPSSVNRQNMTALMRVFASNGTLIRSSPAELGFIGNNTNINSTAPGSQSELATAITDGTVKDVRAFVFFTNAERNGNFSNPVNVNLTLGQKLPK
jgi:hypothetical protein